MEAIYPQSPDRVRREAAQARPAIVEISRPIRQTQTGKIEGHTAQTAPCEFRHQLAVQKAGRRHAVHTHDRRSSALFDYKAFDAASVEVPAGCRMPVDHFFGTHHQSVVGSNDAGGDITVSN